MSDDLDGGGHEKPERTRMTKSDRKSLAIRLIAFSLPIIIISSIGVYHLLLRNWEIDDIADKMIEQGSIDGFEPELVGRTITVEGEVTYIESCATTLGTVNFIDLDNYENRYDHKHPDDRQNRNRANIVEWGDLTVEIGDTLVKDVRFEESYYNDQSRVLSPEINGQSIRSALDLEKATYCYGGICLESSYDEATQVTRADVYLTMGDGFPLEMFDATLLKGVNAGEDERYHVGHGYVSNPEVDRLDSLTEAVGSSGALRFFDANLDGLLNDGDYFEAYLSLPEKDSAIQAYMLQINDGMKGQPHVQGVLSGATYLAMTSKGVLRVTETTLGCPFGRLWSHGRVSLHSEYEDPLGITTVLEVTHIHDDELQLAAYFTCNLRDEKGNRIHCSDIFGGEIGSEGNISIRFHDNGNALFDVGDKFTLSGLQNRTEYRFEVRSLAGPYWLPTFTWRPGIGVTTGYQSVVKWGNPEPQDPPDDLIHKIQIDKIEGVPGVPHAVMKEHPDRVMMIDVYSDGELLLSQEPITENMGVEKDPVNVTYFDADSNGFVNAGDYFIVKASRSALVQVVMGLWIRGAGNNQPIIYRSVSWSAG